MPPYPQQGKELQQSRKCRKQNWLRQATVFEADGGNSHFPVVLSTEQSPWGELLQISGFRTKSPKHQFYMFPYKVTSVHKFKQQWYAQRTAFSHSFIDNMSSDTGFIHQIEFLMNVFFTNQDFLTLRKKILFGAQESQKRINSMYFKAKCNSLGQYAGHWCGSFILI